MIRDYLGLPWLVKVLCLGTLVNRAGSFVLIFLTIYASEQLGFGITFASLCMGALGLGSMIGGLLGGQLADAVGRRFVMLISLFGGAAILFAMQQVAHPWLFLCLVALFALVADMYRPAASAMIADLVNEDRRSHAFALMYISINLGFAIAPPLGGLLAQYSFDWLFWADAVTMASYGLLILFTVPETRPTPQSSIGRGPTIRETMIQLSKDRLFLTFCFSTLLIGIVFMQGMSTLPLFMRQIGISKLHFGLLMSINGILIVLLQLPLTHWLSRFKPMSNIIFGGALIAIGFGLNSLSAATWFIAVTIAVWTIGEILQAPFKQTIVTGLAPSRFRASYLGMFSMSYALALTIGAPLGGVALHRFGATPLWIGSFVIAIAAVTLYGAVYKKLTARVSTTHP